METEKVTVKRVSVITPEGGEADRVEGEFDGLLRRIGDEAIVTFTEETEGEKIVNKVTWNGRSLTVDRRGAVKSLLEFESGKSCESEWKIPPFSLPMTVFTSSVSLLPVARGIGFRVTFRSEVGGNKQTTEMTLTAEAV